MTTSQIPNDTTPASAPRNGRCGRGRKLMLGGAAAIALLGAAAGVTHAVAKPHHGEGWTMDQSLPVDRVEHRADRMLKRVDATSDQQAKVHAIIEAAAKDIDPIRATMTGTHDKVRALLAAPQIDKAAIETLRGQRVAAMDQISHRVTTAMEDAANVLTPDQRQKLAAIDSERAERHHHH
jgi:protein CpxP